MAVIKHHKYVASLPGTLEANSIYYVRAGAGFDIYVTNSSGTIVAYPLNLTDAWALQPIGVPFDIWTHLPGVELPPTDNPNYRYIKLTASDSYNAGVLTSESVSGSAPLVQATAVIDDPGSPFDGETVHLINTERRVIRAGSSGSVEADALQDHDHFQYGGSTSSGELLQGVNVNGRGPSVSGRVHSAGLTTATNNAVVTGGVFNGLTGGNPRTAAETRVKSIGADVFMRIR